MIRGTAFAKVNFGLRVGSRREDGFHPVDGIFQSVVLKDRLSLAAAEIDSIKTSANGQVQDGLDNLAFRAAAAVRDRAGSSQPVAVTLDKTIPYASGMGGGSADAAAALALAARFFGMDADTVALIAPQLGSDVPFCLHGGTARVVGRGEIVTPLAALTGFALGIVVPPIEVATPEAFTRWDEIEAPAGLRMSSSALPPALRPEGELINDLYPAAVAVVPELDDWRQEIETRWDRPVMLSGSGPTLFGFFLDHDEAADAVSISPPGARLAEAVELSPHGWTIDD